MGLTKVIIKHDEWREAFRMLMGLPFLPIECVRRAFNLIVTVNENVDDNLKSILLCLYFY